MIAPADARLRTVDQRLASLLALEDDWDSYGGRPPTATAVILAGRLVQAAYDRYGSLAGSQAAPSAISPLAYGGVELEWEGGSTLVALDIDADGVIGAMTRHGTEPHVTYDEHDALTWDSALSLIGEAFKSDVAIHLTDMIE